VVTNATFSVNSGDTYDSSQYEPNKCRDKCPVSGFGSNDIPPKYYHFGNANGLFWKSITYCNPSCSTATNGAQKFIELEDSVTQFKCVSVCPTTTYYDADNIHAYPPNEVCATSCSFYFLDKDSNNRCSS
jgi:hypothetical protein